MLKNTTVSWGRISRSLHWLSAVVVFGLFALGWWMVDLNYYSDWYKTAPHWHKSIGILLALFTLARVLWRLAQPTPKALGKSWEIAAAHLIHCLLYLLMLAIFFSGYLISTADGRGIEIFDWFTLPSMGELFQNQEDTAGDVHRWLAYCLIGLAVLHAVAALKHHIFDKDQTLVRMLRNTKSKDIQ
ncbi:cytochrome b [Aliiglaciecola sp. CAU 1673]|uniref:cytochrome b n=1 Tax=Aliiglaciecola sp. CAU 1673 TaxID=3032595 RepID=UPI0023D9F786|nr:cytochrome b [Aliiglaciecola sp. CAU 1673]MDF2179544.1 cytochrome b [Aliiglaciecola sp. CAU 1673]